MEAKPLPYMTPEEAGVSSKAVIAMLDAIESDEVCLHGMIILRYGHIIAEGYWKPFHERQKHRMYSCTKSMVSLAIGYMADEKLVSLDDPIIKYYPDKLPAGGVHPYIAETTLRDMLMMATPDDANNYTGKGDDWIKPFFNSAPDHRPGTLFGYDTSASHTLGALVEKLTGKSFVEYLRPKLFERIGVSEDVYCIKDPAGIAWGGSGFVCTTRDFAKIAQTVMRYGKYGDEQVIPEWYVREATAKQIDNYFGGQTVDGRQGYGYQFWRMRNNSFVFWVWAVKSVYVYRIRTLFSSLRETINGHPTTMRRY